MLREAGVTTHVIMEVGTAYLAIGGGISTATLSADTVHLTDNLIAFIRNVAEGLEAREEGLRTFLDQEMGKQVASLRLRLTVNVTAAGYLRLGVAEDETGLWFAVTETASHQGGLTLVPAARPSSKSEIKHARRLGLHPCGGEWRPGGGRTRSGSRARGRACRAAVDSP